MNANRTIFVWPLMVVVVSAAACRDQNSYVEPPAGSYSVSAFDLAADSTDDSVSVAVVRPEFEQASKVHALLGRLFIADDYSTGSPSVMVVTHDFWVRRFGSAPTVIGTKVRLNGQDATIVGVAPADFTFPKHVSAWVPGPPK